MNEEDGMQDVSRGRRSARRAIGWCLAVGALAAALAGCGGSDAAEKPASGGSGSGGGNSVLDAAKAEQAKFFKGEGYSAPPKTSPPPQKGKNVWIMSCDQSIPSCSTPVGGAVEAARAMGWKVTLYDAKLNPARIVEGYRQAIAAKADGMITYSIDCSLAKGALASVKKAGIKVVTGESLDCEGDPQFDYVVDYTQGKFPEWFSATGDMAGTNLIAGTNGAPKVIVLNQTDVPLLVPALDGFKKRMAECGATCEIVDTIDFTTPDLGTSLQQKVQQSLLKNPDANAMYLQYDNYSLGAGPGLRAAGRAGKVLVAVGEGQASTMDELRGGQLSGVGTGMPQSWETYHAVDSLNRLFAGEQPQPSGIGLQAFDKTHNTPQSGRWEPPVDYKAAYKKAWGVDQ
jgi:ribose transport system substrate-binding protein